MVEGRCEDGGDEGGPIRAAGREIARAEAVMCARTAAPSWGELGRRRACASINMSALPSLSIGHQETLGRARRAVEFECWLRDSYSGVRTGRRDSDSRHAAD